MPVVLLAIDACTPLERLLPAAVLMASQHHAALHGVFAQDSRLLRGVDLPFISEVGAYSAACYPVTTESMERRMRDIAEKMRRRLAAAADQQQIPWEFQTCAGSISQITQETPAEVVFPGWNSNFSASSAQVSCSVSKISATAVVVDDGSPAATHVISAARQLAHATERHQLIVFKLLVDSERSAKAEFLNVPVASTRAHDEIVIRVTSTEQLIQQLGLLHPSVMLIGREQQLVEDSLFLWELSRSKCPVALLKSTW